MAENGARSGWAAVRDLTDRDAVLAAIREYDEMGADAFLAKYGFGRSQKYRIRHDGHLYDINPILAAAYSRQFPDREPITSENSTSGLRTTVPKAHELGFEVDGVVVAEEGDGAELSTSLEDLAALWRQEAGYPTERDLKKKHQREELAAALTEESLERVIADPGEFDILGFGRLASTAYGGAGNQSIAHKHVAEGPEAKLRVAEALRHLLFDGGEPRGRLDDVILTEEWHPTGFGEGLATKSLAVVDPDRWLPLYQYSGSMGKLRLMESPELGIEIPDDLEERSLGERIEWTNDRLREVTEPLFPGDPWGQMVFLYWLRERHSPAVAGTSSVALLAEELLVGEEWLEEVIGLLAEKRQVIFQGPPGTGKTYVARRLGRYFEEQGGGTETVQFHPSYSYEDFIEGYRPTVVGGQPGFELVTGPLKRMAMRAEADPDHRYVLVIDELNRANVAKVFGELYFLLEYRSERIRLQYADPDGEDSESSRFALPKNLWIVATMNTADRSIALMDAALRRRFYFVDFYPDRPPVKGLLDRWLGLHDLRDLAWISDVLAAANAKLDDVEAAVGPSHFLLRDPAELDEARIARIWSHAVLPYLQERLIGEPERLAEFRLAALRQGQPPSLPDEAGGESQGEQGPGS